MVVEFSQEQREDVREYSMIKDGFLPESYSLEIDGEYTEIVGLLGAGGTKEVYDAEIGGERKALGLPNTGNRPEDALTKWRRALREPANTETIREIGLNTNRLCEPRTADFGDYRFPVVVMDRYQDQDFRVYDAKNRHSLHDFMDPEIEPEEIAEALSKVAEDIALLVENHVLVDRDSFNLCEKDGVLQAYFNDLGTMQVVDRDISERLEGYSDFAIGAFLKTAQPSDVEGTDYGFLTVSRSNAESELEKLVNQELNV